MFFILDLIEADPFKSIVLKVRLIKASLISLELFRGRLSGTIAVYLFISHLLNFLPLFFQWAQVKIHESPPPLHWLAQGHQLSFMNSPVLGPSPILLTPISCWQGQEHILKLANVRHGRYLICIISFIPVLWQMHVGFFFLHISPLKTGISKVILPKTSHIPFPLFQQKCISTSDSTIHAQQGHNQQTLCGHILGYQL